jgi:4-hydroxy-tetrahydrodipicolinate synthase
VAENPFGQVLVALVTPFTHDGEVDWHDVERLIDDVVTNGADGIVVTGTTGETSTLTDAEKVRLVEVGKQVAGSRAKIIMGGPSNETAHAIELAKKSEKAGADGIMAVTPYYNKPTAEGLFRHFKAIADSTKLPIMLYSVPGRCGIEIGIDVVVRLVESCPNIVAIKEAGGAPDKVSQMKSLLPASFEILSGDDSLTLPFMSVGAVGIVSVASNLIPKEMSQLVQHALKGEWAAAQAIHAKFNPLFSAFLKLSSNPIPIKAAMALKGLCSEELRLPLCEMTGAQTAELKATMEKLGLL